MEATSESRSRSGGLGDGARDEDLLSERRKVSPILRNRVLLPAGSGVVGIVDGKRQICRRNYQK